MSLLKLSLLINVSIDSDYDYLYLYSYYPDSLELHNKSAALSARRKVASQLNTHRKNAISQRRSSEIDSSNTLIDTYNSTLLIIKERTIIITKTISLSTKLLIL